MQQENYILEQVYGDQISTTVSTGHLENARMSFTYGISPPPLKIKLKRHWTSELK